eukprot:1160131-Pelagomonas_calceolata.AAC.2
MCVPVSIHRQVFISKAMCACAISKAICACVDPPPIVHIKCNVCACVALLAQAGCKTLPAARLHTAARVASAEAAALVAAMRARSLAVSTVYLSEFGGEYCVQHLRTALFVLPAKKVGKCGRGVELCADCMHTTLAAVAKCLLQSPCADCMHILAAVTKCLLCMHRGACVTWMTKGCVGHRPAQPDRKNGGV